MEGYASFEATAAALLSLGFIQFPDEADRCWFDSPKETEMGLPVVQAYVYQCCAGYWCVELDGGYAAPIVWHGPRADWDKTNALDEFVSWLNEHHAGWR